MMPLHDVGYRTWDGQKSSLYSRWWVIATVGIQLALRSSWLSRTLVISWVPAIAVGVGFFLYEQSIVRPELRRGIASTMSLAGAGLELTSTVLSDPEDGRHEVWASLLLVFFRYPQAILMLVVVGIVAPRLISYDLRNRGYLLYFSRPIRVWEYIVGKSLVIWFFLALITTLPATILYIVGLALSPQLDVVFESWDLIFRILAASIVLMLPVTAVALACSAMTVESRYAVFAWFALWVVGWVAYSVLSVGELAGQQEQLQEPFEQLRLPFSRWELISPYHLLGRVQQWVFGLFPPDRSIAPYLAELITITVVCLWFVHRKLRSRLHS